MSAYPTEINEIHKTLESLKGIENVSSGVGNLGYVTQEDLTSPEYAHLPIATLRRTNGGLPGEVMIQFEFSIDRTNESLLSLEFLAWFVRDQSRGGNKIQLRPFALPPQTPAGVQLGSTLKFHIDYFFDNIRDSLQPVLEQVASLNKALQLFINLYKVGTKEE
ncbi:MAG: hypothetical protein J0I41_23400 [Filimonas sp.]|nr:hypothetical protein [Filimonas sp.]